MRTLILLAAVSLAVIIRATGNPQLSELKFGDILAFPKDTFLCFPLKYKHYGIYLDRQIDPAQEAAQNLFHFYGPVVSPTLSNCIFAVLDTSKPFEKDNYLDDYPKFQNTDRTSEENIIKRIKEMHKKCASLSTMWKPTTNNCEHLATYVRYGYKISLQRGQQAEGKVSNPKVDKEMDEDIKTYLKGTYNNIQGDMTEACGCDTAAAAG